MQKSADWYHRAADGYCYRNAHIEKYVNTAARAGCRGIDSFCKLGGLGFGLGFSSAVCPGAVCSSTACAVSGI